MPVDQTVALNITCDNPDCPGNNLPVDDRTGWTFVSTEVYGQPTEQHVYCCPECASTIGEVLAADSESAPEPA